MAASSPEDLTYGTTTTFFSSGNPDNISHTQIKFENKIKVIQFIHAHVKLLMHNSFQHIPHKKRKKNESIIRGLHSLLNEEK